jgi:hypothetical protein
MALNCAELTLTHGGYASRRSGIQLGGILAGIDSEPLRIASFGRQRFSCGSDWPLASDLQ